MIQAKMIFKDNSITGYQIRGHAGFAAKGQDIVCAAVSVLAITVTNELTVPTISENDDNSIVVNHIPSLTQNVALTKALLHGLQEIADQYPDRITVIRVDMG